MFVVPGSVHETYVSYSGGDYIDWRQLATFLEWNKRNEALVRAGKAIFLPREFVVHDERAGYTDTTVYRAPLVQDALAARFVPANGGYSASDPRSQILLFGQIMLPYFPEISIADLVKVAKNETEAFTRFTYRLRQMLAEVPAADSRQAL